MRPTVTALLAVTCLVVAGCSGPGDGDEPGGADTATGATDAAASGEAEIPDGPAGDHVRWVLDLLAEDGGDPADLTEDEVAERVSPAVAEQLTVEVLTPALAQVRAGGPYTVGTVVPQGSTGLQVRLEPATGAPLQLVVAVDGDGLLSTLLFTPVPVVPDVASYAELEALLAEDADHVQLLVADVVDGRCEPTYATEDPVAAPSGSVFKLVVLNALVEAVADGDLAWDDELTVTDEVRSLPSGELQDRPDGTVVTVEEAALGMISISDNTATDLLMAALGDRVDAWATEHGLDDLVPVPTTRQLFRLGWGAPEQRAQWSAADAEERRAILDALPGLEGLDPATVTTPGWTDGVEYFLTPAQACGLHVALHEAGSTPAGAPLARILTTNPGLEPPAGADAVAFKGGSSPGVVALTFLVSSGDTTRYLGVQVWDDEVVDLGVRVPGPAQAGLDLLLE
ncbi:serine hydrolase [Nocardioides zeae]|uniref:Serine hydrolase n=1 Tax=Nocardioides imazamoxiresistens TaxID=3231893 RepID=A0ABU3PUL4_9ACTN|nr:serine hydrolase [Nocardioides zeae]MDT9592901.1 serine hydrolase [Nocardioides zeae]